MTKKTDIIVVGAGPCGSYSAYTAAKLGANVTVYETHKTVGAPKHCAGHINIKSLQRLGIKVPKQVLENEIKGAVFYSASGNKFILRCQKPVTHVLDRELFDQHIAELAENEGASIELNSPVKSLVFGSGCVKGVSLKGGKTLESKIVIDAEGCSSSLLKQAGLQGLNSTMIARGIQAEVDNIKDVDNDMVEVYLGNKVAPGFFAWIIPRKDGSAKVGLAARHGDPHLFLKNFMTKHPVASKKLNGSKTMYLSAHPIPLEGPIPKTYTNGFLAVGDAASQVKATTGGGVVFGLTCAEVAGTVAVEAVNAQDFSEVFLSTYQSRWKKLVGFDLSAMLQMRKMLDSLSDRRIDRVIDLANMFGIDVLLEKFGDLDFQGRSLIPMMRYPATLAVVGYFVFGYLTSTQR